MEWTSRQKVGQKLVIGFPGTEVDEKLEEFIRAYQIGNFILFKHNIESVPQVTRLCQRLQSITKEATGYPAFITIDQEGGMVTRLSDDCMNLPGAMAMAAIGDQEKIYQVAKLTGEQLRALGINFNLAPVVDINSNADNPVIGVRSYGDQPEEVAKCAVAMVNGLLDGGVLASAKHFPGHGDTSVDSHLSLPQVNKTLEEVMECELVPYKAVIEAGIPAIMTTHILYPALEDQHLPATMSRKIITGLLKEKLGFKGLVISDCMEMNAIKEYYGTVNGILSAVKAGVDLVFVSHTMSLAKEASDAMTAALDRQELSVEEMDASVQKILSYKKQLVKMQSLGESGPEFSYEKAKKYSNDLLRQSITFVKMPTSDLPVLSKNSVFLGCYPFRATLASNEYEESFHFADVMAERFGGRGIRTSYDPSQEEMESYLVQAENADVVVIGTYNAHLYEGQRKLVLEAAKRHQKVIVVALRNPYDLKHLPDRVYGIAAYEYTRNSLAVIADVLAQRQVTEAKLPVQL